MHFLFRICWRKSNLGKFRHKLHTSLYQLLQNLNLLIQELTSILLGPTKNHKKLNLPITPTLFKSFLIKDILSRSTKVRPVGNQVNKLGLSLAKLSLTGVELCLVLKFWSWFGEHWNYTILDWIEARNSFLIEG